MTATQAMNTQSALHLASELVLRIELGMANTAEVAVRCQQLHTTFAEHHAEAINQFGNLARLATAERNPHEREHICMLLVDCWDELVHAARSSTVESLAAQDGSAKAPTWGAPSAPTNSGQVSRQSSGLSSHRRTFLSEKASSLAAMVGWARAPFLNWRANLNR